MRKLLTVAAMAAAALGAAAACTTAAPAGTATSSPAVTTAAAADSTKAVCTDAVGYASTASANVLAKYNEGAQAVAANDLAKAQQVAAEGKQLLTEWSTKFKGLSAQPIKPDVKTAIDEMTAFLDQTVNATAPDPAALQSQFTQLSGKLTTACAGA